MDDTIGLGVFVGETVRDCIRKYGRKSILEILKYYDLDEEILRDYHYKDIGPHKDSPEEDKKEQDWVQELLSSPISMEETFVTTTTQEGEDEERSLDLYEEYENEMDCYENSVLDDPEDDDGLRYPKEWRDSYKPWIYGR
jgi:hypothetical protein